MSITFVRDQGGVKHSGELRERRVTPSRENRMRYSERSAHARVHVWYTGLVSSQWNNLIRFSLMRMPFAISSNTINTKRSGRGIVKFCILALLTPNERRVLVFRGILHIRQGHSFTKVDMISYGRQPHCLATSIIPLAVTIGSKFFTKNLTTGSSNNKGVNNTLGRTECDSQSWRRRRSSDDHSLWMDCPISYLKLIGWREWNLE